MMNTDTPDQPFACVANVAASNKGGGKCVVKWSRYLERIVREKIRGKHLGTPALTRRYYNFTSMAFFTLLDRYSKITKGSHDPFEDLVSTLDAFVEKFVRDLDDVPHNYHVPNNTLAQRLWARVSPKSRKLLAYISRISEPSRLDAHYFEYMKALQSKNLPADQIQVEFDVFSQYIDFFSKRQTKASIRHYFERVQKAGQGVSAFQKHVNALFAPYARNMAEIFHDILKENVILASNLPDAELYARAAHCMSDSEAAGHHCRNFAGDFTEYDSSQYSLSALINATFMAFMGAPELLIDLYVNMRHSWVLADDVFKLYGHEKMHSGEPFTLIGNTAFGMFVIAHCITFSHLSYAMFKGDDSGLHGTDLGFNNEALHWLLDRGLQLKDEFPPAMEFAGAFVTPDGGFPDVIRKVAKFLSTIFADDKHYRQFILNLDADLAMITSYRHFLVGCEYVATYYNSTRKTNPITSDDVQALVGFMYHHKRTPFDELVDFSAEALHFYTDLRNIDLA